MKVSDLTGQRFGRLVVIARDGSTRHGNATWRCACDCGNEIVAAGGHLKADHTRSCGCLVKELVAGFGLASKLKHGHSSDRDHSPTYRSWHAMHQRCENPKHKNFKFYGGRGVKVCERWKSFEAFLSDMGERPEGKTIDRLNSDGHYEPNNCRWATSDQQVKNRRPRGKSGAALPVLSATHDGLKNI